jgi:hypothetical protein
MVFSHSLYFWFNFSILTFSVSVHLLQSNLSTHYNFVLLKGQCTPIAENHGSVALPQHISKETEQMLVCQLFNLGISASQAKANLQEEEIGS